jgi:hypothetical protein
MIRYGKVTRFVLRHFLRDGFPSDRALSLSTAELKAMRQMRKRKQQQGLAHMYANRVKPGATGVVVHTYEDGVAYEVEVLREDGNTVSVDTVTATELQEMAWLEERDNVSDEQLIARMQSVPESVGSLLVELSEFVRRRSKK